MSNPIREELQRLTNRFLFYGRTILIGMSITAVFFVLYAGLRANYFTIQIITVFLSTLSVALAALVCYFILRIQRESSRIRFLSEAKLEAQTKELGGVLNEKLIRQLVLDVQELTPRPLKAGSSQEQVEGGLFRLTFLLSYRVAYAFYCTLQLLRFDLPGLKSEKKI
jgi:hypothetical protein